VSERFRSIAHGPVSSRLRDRRSQALRGRVRALNRRRGDAQFRESFGIELLLTGKRYTYGGNSGSKGFGNRARAGCMDGGAHSGEEPVVWRGVNGKDVLRQRAGVVIPATDQHCS